MNVNPPINFRNFTFREQEQKLQISKQKGVAGDPFCKLVQQYPCARLIERYTSHLTEKMKALMGFKPSFVSMEAIDAFQLWHGNQRVKIEKKLENPLNALQAKVAKRFDQLFEQNGKRTIILGCGHLREGTLLQTSCEAYVAFPKRSHEKEQHLHTQSVCIDWRADLKERMEFQVGKKVLTKWRSYPEISPNGPDFARRRLEYPVSMNDFCALRNVKYLHAERVPFLERGVVKCKGAANNIFLLKEIFQILAPGGTFSFDIGIIVALRLGGILTSKIFKQDAYQKYAQDQEGFQKLCEAKEKEVEQDQEYLELLDHAIEDKLVFYENSTDDIKPELVKMEVLRRAKAQVKLEYLEYLKTVAKEYVQRNREKVLLKGNEIFIIFNHTAKCTLSKVRDGSAREMIKQWCDQIPEWIEHIEVHPQEDEMLFGKLAALHHQLVCYNTLHLNPELIHELLPENKAILDETLKEWSLVMGKHFEALGFENATLQLDGLHPENGRPYSRIMTVRKPNDPNATFKET